MFQKIILSHRDLAVKGLKYIELKIKSEIEQLFFKPIMVSIDDMDRFEQKEINWYDWLINCIPEPIKKL